MLGNLPVRGREINYTVLSSIMYLVNAWAVDYYVTPYVEAKGYAIIVDYMNCLPLHAFCLSSQLKKRGKRRKKREKVDRASHNLSQQPKIRIGKELKLLPSSIPPQRTNGYRL